MPSGICFLSSCSPALDWICRRRDWKKIPHGYEDLPMGRMLFNRLKQTTIEISGWPIQWRSVAKSHKRNVCLFFFLLVYAACHPERITSIFYCWGKLNKTRDQSTIFTQPNNTSCYSQLYSFQFRRTKKTLTTTTKIFKKKNRKCQKKEHWYKYSNWMIVHFQWCVTRV